MPEKLQVADLQEFILQIWMWIQANILDWTRLLDLALMVIIWFAMQVTSKWLRARILSVAGDNEWVQIIDRRFLHPIMHASLALMLFYTARFIVEPYLGPAYFMGIATSLLAAWLVIRLATGFVANREIARFIAAVAWGVAALNIIGLLDPILEVLRGANLPLGEVSISALDIINGIISFTFFMWGALAIARLIENRMKAMSTLPPSAQVLFVKAGKIILVTIAFLLALNATGIDLTALAVFGGALGVGIGFGLQKVVGNFISGLILLMDNSIKPGDVVETGGTYGVINKLAARYTSVITRDGTEYLIPNEDMITQPVINWSHTDTNIRRKIPVQIAYQCDPRRAMELMIEAAHEEGRVLKNKEPQCRVMNFGENGIDLELRLWISDAHSGVNNVASAVRLRIWDKFNEEGISFPYPTRVIHMKTHDGAIPKRQDTDK